MATITRVSPGRFWIGMAQMGAATVAVMFLFSTGVSALTLVSTLVTTGLTVFSRTVYRNPR